MKLHCYGEVALNLLCCCKTEIKLLVQVGSIVDDLEHTLFITVGNKNADTCNIMRQYINILNDSNSQSKLW
jgi:hypothetical protein